MEPVTPNFTGPTANIHPVLPGTDVDLNPLAPPLVRLPQRSKSPDQIVHIHRSSELNPEKFRAGLEAVCAVVSTISLPPETRALLFDFDGTVADSEPLHEASYQAAVLKHAGFNIKQHWELFSKAFHRAEMDSCTYIVDLLEEHFGGAYDKLASAASRTRNITTDPRQSLAEFIRDERVAAVQEWAADTVCRQVNTQLGPVLSLTLSPAAQLKALDGHMSCFASLDIRTTPGMLQLLATAEEQGLPAAVVTSSGGAFVGALLGAFGLSSRFAVKVFAEDATSVKPHPDPWRKALRQLNDLCRAHQLQRPGMSEEDVPLLNPKTVVAFENTAGGAFSALMAGMTVFASNSDGLETKLAAEIHSLDDKKIVGNFPAQRRRFGRLIDGVTALADPFRILCMPHWTVIDL